MGQWCPPMCICGFPIKDLPQDHKCLPVKPPVLSPRSLALHDLRYLLTFDHLGAWGMETLHDTLLVLLPELRTPAPIAPPSTIAE